jgi:hypothetical protein
MIERETATLLRCRLALLALLLAVPESHALAQMPDFREARRFGGERELGGVSFGIAHAAELDDTHIWIADRLGHQIMVIELRTGRHAIVGRRGRGPGELLEPWAMTRLADGRVIVLDSGNGRLAVLGRSDGRAEILSTVPLRLVAHGLCALRNELFVLGYQAGRTVHRVDPNGAVFASFGRPFRSETPLLAQLGNRGLLLCRPLAEASGRIVVASEEFGIVHAFDPQGGLLWSASLPGFRPIQITFPRGGGVTYSQPPEGSYHVVVSLWTVPGGEDIIVQVAEVQRGMKREEAAVTRSHRLSAVTGEVLETSTDLPRIDRVHGAHAIGLDNAFVPVVVLYEFVPRRR